MRRSIAVAAATVLALISSPAAAQFHPDFYVAFEGQAGFRSTEPVVPFVAQPRPQFAPNGDGLNDWLEPDVSIVSPLSGRFELGTVADFAASGAIRIGTVISGWSGTDESVVDPSYGLIQCRAGPGKPECEIRICYATVTPCGSVMAAMTRRYWEVAADLALGFRTGPSTILFGAQPFYGQLIEQIAYDGVGTMDWDGRLDAQFIGTLLFSAVEIEIGDRWRVFTSLGAGYYRLAAAGVFANDVGLSQSPIVLTDSGWRAQAAVGAMYEARPGLKVGLVGRADYWTRFPGLTVPRSGIPQCAFRPDGAPVCEPPRVTGSFGSSVGEMLHLTIGLRLVLELGS